MKKGILVVSFGTSYSDTRAVTIDAIEKEIKGLFADVPFYRAWTSRMILSKLQETTGEKIFTVSEALLQMKKDGVTDVYIQPTHVINGIENDRMKEDALALQEFFHSISFGAPLLSSTEDMREVVQIIGSSFSNLNTSEALVLMGHGSEHYANTVYPALDYMFKEMGYPHIHMGTVEAYPELLHVTELLKKSDVKTVHLVPFMIVAGDHANNDMAGEEKNSWKSVFENEGYKVVCHLKGLGEYNEIRKMFVKHLKAVI
ncbi:sirohydrochlorin cobaltochelatase [Lachnospiraceae bacterium 42-17]|jgi:sirohydrochlorin cobaltochelatase|nr:sirohydrochlorin cobaltochelatase [Dorea sp.]